jgi:hypothetical protein
MYTFKLFREHIDIYALKLKGDLTTDVTQRVQEPV